MSIIVDSFSPELVKKYGTENIEKVLEEIAHRTGGGVVVIDSTGEVIARYSNQPSRNKKRSKKEKK
jgi:hypothetical protein